MTTTVDKIFYFKGSKNRLLSGFIHLPEITRKNIGIVYCHPFADEHNLSYRVVVNTARSLAELGVPVLRFHLSGCGDSEGELNEVTIDDWQEDLQTAISVLKSEARVEQYALWGLRLGAGLVLKYMNQNKEASFVILWQPVLSFSQYIKQFLRRKELLQLAEGKNRCASVQTAVDELINQGTVSIIGYPINRALYDDFNKIHDQPFNVVPDCDSLLLSLSLMEQPSLLIKRYSEFLLSRETPLTFLHLKAESFWDNYWRWECPEITYATLKWMNDLLRAEINGESRTISL